MVAGIMAFGASLLAAALLPISRFEEQSGAKLHEHADLLEPAKQEAVEPRRTSATKSASRPPTRSRP
ncbi:hypothetical protein [Kitasatospora sp. NPDC059571]|uniref:hypothetical protein n=1 Tax=Kitasatospora sp. NPDC059571 TaxID=3346871 RepID=UPI0036A4AA4A